MAAPSISLLGATYSDVAGVTLPKSGGGTATFPWVEGSETKTANGTYDVTNLAQLIVSVSGGGSSGLVYESGIYTPTADTAVPTISFSNSHTDCPFFAMIGDADGYLNTANSNIRVIYVYTADICGEIYTSSSNIFYGEVRYAYRGSNGSSLSTSTSTLSYPSSNTGTSSFSYPRYWVTPSAFKPQTSSNSRYWRKNRNYKWIAVWKPTS